MPAVVHLPKRLLSRRPRHESSPPASQNRPVSFFLHEPFFQFLALGFLIWLAIEYWSSHNSRYVIELGPAERERIAVAYQQQFGQRPSAAELRALIDRRIREEIYLHEGLALHLDRDDEIVRRRIVQKYEFLATDLATPESPTPAVLARWLEQHKSRYLVPERVSLTQVYFSTDRDGELAARTRAESALKRLREKKLTRAPNLGDPFPGPTDVTSVSLDEAARLFGDSELCQALFHLPVGQWSGPYRSGYGWHLVYLTGHELPVLPALATVRDQVLSDYLEEARRDSNERAYEKLRAKYTVRYGTSG